MSTHIISLYSLTIPAPAEVNYKSFPWKVENYEGFISFTVSHNERMT